MSLLWVLFPLFIAAVAVIGYLVGYQIGQLDGEIKGLDKDIDRLREKLGLPSDKGQASA